ncbi:GNAT family N-acetyltransferase [Lapidilactobacillus bayanensis]|uniref:GNAT family N-acetyltransferase n=1 Tax=Lapidilactobacillus bayanensis TaxID=2485998 RepID=UPI000F7918C1|nr:GNAT family N-acetyltransferase [Lapidilactobacillus bayanensis]
MSEVVEIDHADVDLLNEYYELCCYAFDRPNNEAYQTKWLNLAMHSHNYAIVDAQGHVKSAIMVTYLPTNWHGQEYQMGGVGYVASYPEFGGHGAITLLMQKATEQMLADHVILSYLAPFSYTFYRRFGFEEVFDRLHYEVRAADFPRVSKQVTGSVERGNFTDNLDQMAQIYQQNEQSQNGGLIRHSWWQQYRYSKHPNFEVALSYDDEHQLDGYLIYQRISGQQFEMVELMPNSFGSFQRLLSFVGKHAGVYPKFVYTSANQTPYNDLMPEAYHVQTTLEPYMMARINNWQLLVENWHFTADLKQPLIIEIKDQFIPENNGKWQLSIVDGRGQLRHSSELDADLIADTRQLAKAFLGYRTLAQLVQTGNCQIESQAVLTELQSCLSYPNKPMLWDYF